MRPSIILPTLALALLPLAACDTKPNTKFEENMQEAQAARTIDRFYSLNAAGGRFRLYMQAAETQKAQYLVNLGNSVPGAIAGALGMLTSLPIGDHAGVAAQCKTAIDAAIAFRATPPAKAAESAIAKTLYANLNTCRERANAAEEGATKEVKETLSGWRRTASTAMIVLGLSLVERGDTATGIPMWREADKAAVADQPGARMSASDFVAGVNFSRAG